MKMDNRVSTFTQWLDRLMGETYETGIIATRIISGMEVDENYRKQMIDSRNQHRAELIVFLKSIVESCECSSK
jgi:hypothetical protein